ncbi:hypothetical protein [Solimonas sp. SE-A11]|uniref:hypothetical protein n=1 Tax=Solimonas sp. SE-A11 TaxID=3054954 RepID=UPI00259D2287|nr:hypothetical protein [Solimonas sp. SE-A11]MDM4770271.1 hypothetical protein [Solimonas sp. SE-A11]
MRPPEFDEWLSGLPPDPVVFIGALWALAIIWQFLSGHIVLGLHGASISRSKEALLFWTLLLAEAATLIWVFIG